MSGTPRTRERDLSFVSSGTAYNNVQRTYNGAPYGAPYGSYLPYSNKLWQTGYEYCDDTVSDSIPYPDHDLRLYKQTVKRGKLEGENIYSPAPPTGWGWERKTIYTAYVEPWWADIAYGPTPAPVPNWSYLVTKALANANPENPVMDIPLFLFELREFPRMLRDLGRVLRREITPRDIPGGYLAYEFGWKPLLNDLLTLLGLADSLNQHLQLMKDIKGGKKIRRTLGRRESLWSEAPYFLDNLPHTRRFAKKEKEWFEMRYRITNQELFEDASDKVNAAKRILGLNFSMSTIWNMFPWSWLIDYFLNIGDIYAANRGYLPLQATEMSIMQQVEETMESADVVPPAGTTFTDYRFTTVTKSRYCTDAPSIAVAFTPMLTQRQEAIIGALVLTRVLR